jgi:hypothetical protein
MPAARVPRAARARRARRGPTASTPSCPARVIPATGHDRDLRFFSTNKGATRALAQECLSGLWRARRESRTRRTRLRGLRIGDPEKKRATCSRQRPKNLRRVPYEHLVCSRPLVGARSEERSRTLGVTHKRHSENGLRRPRKARFFVSDASPRALHDARTRRATLPPSGRPTPVTPVLARSRRTSARTRTRTPRVRPLRE